MAIVIGNDDEASEPDKKGPAKPILYRLSVGYGRRSSETGARRLAPQNFENLVQLASELAIPVKLPTDPGRNLCDGSTTYPMRD